MPDAVQSSYYSSFTPLIYTPPLSSPLIHPPLPPPFSQPLIRPRRLLTSLQLLHIPAADREIPPVLIHAPRKSLDIRRARPLLLRLSITTLALTIIQPIIHRLRIRISSTLLRLRCRRRTTTKHPTQRMPDRGPDCDASKQEKKIQVSA